MGLFGKKDDNGNKGRGNKGPKPMTSNTNRFKSKKELKPMIKKAESEAKRSNGFKSMMNQAAGQAVSTATAGARAGLERKALLGDMPIVDREKQTTSEQDYDRGAYENSYSPGKKALKGDQDELPFHLQKAIKASPGRKVMDADTEDMPIVTDEKDGAYVAKMYGNPHPAQKRMGDMVAAAQMAYGDKNMSAPGKQVKAEKKKSYEDAFKSRDMKTYGDLSKQEYFNEASRQNDMKSSTGSFDAPAKPMVGKDPNRFEGRPGVEILGDEMLNRVGIESPTGGNPDTDYFVKDGKILGGVSLENKNVVGVNVPETGMLLRNKPIKPKNK
jgi:hypothetical protein